MKNRGGNRQQQQHLEHQLESLEHHLEPLEQLEHQHSEHQQQQQLNTTRQHIMTYDDMLAKMNMGIYNGELHRRAPTNPNPDYNKQLHSQQNNYNNHNNYYDENQSIVDEQPRKLTRNEYAALLIQNINRKNRIRQIKSSKLMFSNGLAQPAQAPQSAHYGNNIFRLLGVKKV